MSVLSRAMRLFGTFGPERRSGIQSPLPASYAARSAAPVTFDTAMTVSAFWASVRLVSELIGSMPMVCRRRDGEGWKEDRSYKLWRVLNYSPNRYQTRTEFMETLGLQLTTSGNFYGAKETDAAGNVVGILPLMSGQVSPELLRDGSVIYRYIDTNGTTKIYAESSIWHVKLFGNALVGLSPMAYARQSLGIALAADNRTSTISANGGKTSGVLMLDKVLTPEHREQIRKNFAELTEGASDQLFVLEAGAKFQHTALSPVDQQLLESRQFQIEDVARFMGVPSVLINHTGEATTWGSGIQQIVDGFYKLNLRPYLERIEASIEKHLMPVADRGEVEIAFSFDALLRADAATRAEADQKEINAGIATPNEKRRARGLPPMPGGETLLVNSTMIPISEAARPILPRRD